MLREDSQIDFAEENVILDVSLRPSLLVNKVYIPEGLSSNTQLVKYFLTGYWL